MREGRRGGNNLQLRRSVSCKAEGREGRGGDWGGKERGEGGMGKTMMEETYV